MEKYSVLMSVYARVKPDELKLSINSMLQQTVKPDQFVIVWDGPVGDALKYTVQQFEVLYPDVFTTVQLEENHGLAYALNEGLKHCRHDLVARMDSDDYSLPERCEKQLREFERDNQLALLGGNTQHFHDDISKTDKRSYQPIGEDAIKKCLRRNSAFSHPTVMFRKSCVEACGGYDSNLRRSQDHDLFSKMVWKGYRCLNLEDILVLFRADENMMLRNRNPESCKARMIIQKMLLKRKQCSMLDYIYVCSGVTAMKLLPEKLYIAVYKLLKEKSE